MLRITPEMVADLMRRQPDYVETLDVCHHGIDRDQPCAGCASEKFARVIPEPESPPDWLGYGALAAYAAALTVLGIALLRWVA